MLDQHGVISYVPVDSKLVLPSEVTKSLLSYGKTEQRSIGLTNCRKWDINYMPSRAWRFMLREGNDPLDGHI